MSYRVEELAEVANVGVDTIRYYQRRKLLAPPTRQGRIAVYNDTHLTRLREIHDLSERGFTLAQIRELSTGNASGLLADLAGRNAADPDLDRSELARRAEIPEFMIDVVVGAGLITPSGEGAEQRFSPDAVEMLAAARVLIASGVSFEELTALAMRHATHVEDVVDDSIELFKRHSDHQGGDRDELVGLLARLVPVASGLVARHFEQTLVSRALARLTDDTAIGGGTIVVGRRLAKRLDPVAVFAASSEHHRALWIRPEFDLSLVALGAVETITPIGDGRFSAASAARAALAARTQRVGPRDAPAPVLVGGFSFTCAEQSAAPPPEGQTASPDWSGFPDARWVLPAITVVDRTDGTWLLAAAKVGDGEDEARATAALDERLDVFAEDLPAPLTSPFEVAAGEVAADDQHYLSRIGDALEAIADDEFRKVVLARIHEEAVVDPIDVLHRLRHRYQNCAVFSIAVGNRQFLGASPEQLVSLDGPEVRTEAVAGTISTSSTVEADESQADESLAAELMTSPKIRAEHKFVVDDIIGRLEVLGLQGMYNPEPEIMRLARVQHLRTPISAQVQRRAGGVSDMDVLRVASVLHPTPAVAGTPTETAVGWILEREGFDRGWYAAPVGWCDLDGNGELCVALRSALVNDSAAVLFSGAGVVAESVPSDELAETGAKLRALLDVMETSSGC